MWHERLDLHSILSDHPIRRLDVWHFRYFSDRKYRNPTDGLLRPDFYGCVETAGLPCTS